jgi:hypothetical protein
MKFVPFNKRKPFNAITKMRMQRAHYEATRVEPVKITLAKAPWEKDEKEENDDGPDNPRL